MCSENQIIGIHRGSKFVRLDMEFNMLPSYVALSLARDFTSPSVYRKKLTQMYVVAAGGHFQRNIYNTHATQ